MSANGTPWKISGILLPIISTALLLAVPAHTAYDLWGRGPIPEKQVELVQDPPISLTSSASLVGERAILSLTVGGNTYDNVEVATAYLQNVGSSPILPTDYYEKLSVTVDPPWKMIGVDNRRSAHDDIPLTWNRVSDTKFEAEPTLLNPGDHIAALVYLTNTQSTSAAGASNGTSKPSLKWSAHIANLRSLTEEPSPWGSGTIPFPAISIMLAGPAVPFMWLAALIIEASYILLLVQTQLVRRWNWKSISLLLIASVLSYSGAGCIAEYIFTDPLTKMLGVNPWLNVPAIAVNVLALSGLFIFRWARHSKLTQQIESQGSS
jgi:hypothetical protein